MHTCISVYTHTDTRTQTSFYIHLSIICNRKCIIYDMHVLYDIKYRICNVQCRIKTTAFRIRNIKFITYDNGYMIYVI